MACCILSFIYGVESDVLQPFHGDMSFSHQDEGLKPPFVNFPTWRSFTFEHMLVQEIQAI